MTGARILVVDDSPDTVEVLTRNLTRDGHRTWSAGSVKEAIAVLARTPLDLVITDLKLPGPSGLDLIRHVRENYRDVEVLMITGYPSVESAVTALREGADDYLPKPFTADELKHALDRVLTKLGARRTLSGAAASREDELGLVGASPAFVALRAATREVAAGSGPLLIAGPRGSGRGAISRAVHAAGARHEAPFVRLDAEALPEARALAELGQAIAAAGDGTLYVAEVAALPRAARDELDRRLAAAGGPRIVASSAVDLHAAARRGAFEPSLAGRLSSARLDVPSLAARRDDVPLLVRAIAERAAHTAGLDVPRVADRALDALIGYEWPGEVAELADVVAALVERTAGRTIELPDLPAAVRAAAHRAAPDRPLAEIESEYIRDVLSWTGGNRSRAAEVLGIDRKTLREKLRRTDDDETR